MKLHRLISGLQYFGKGSKMGLDMFAMAVASTEIQEGVLVDFAMRENAPELSEIYYWRDDYDLHDWMVSLYDRKSGIDPSFNLANMLLVKEDIEHLSEQFKDGRYVEFTNRALKAINQGLKVFYYSWY